MQCPNCRCNQGTQPGGWKYATGAVRQELGRSQRPLGSNRAEVSSVALLSEELADPSNIRLICLLLAFSVKAMLWRRRVIVNHGVETELVRQLLRHLQSRLEDDTFYLRLELAYADLYTEFQELGLALDPRTVGELVDELEQDVERSFPVHEEEAWPHARSEFSFRQSREVFGLTEESSEITSNDGSETGNEHDAPDSSDIAVRNGLHASEGSDSARSTPSDESHDPTEYWEKGPLIAEMMDFYHRTRTLNGWVPVDGSWGSDNPSDYEVLPDFESDTEPSVV